ncbi:MAG TPA: FIST N-terminal domain-containing protein [Acidimicrobiales bacterium]|nr:FIST N-terminal domain-containing protein [Acidimicrobiales bacterium]
MERSRWFAVGQAGPYDDRPGFVAADRALIGEDAKLAVVFCSQSQDVAGVVSQIGDRAGEVPVIGCSTAGEIATAGAGDASVVVAALGGPGFSVRTALATGASGDLRHAGAVAAGACQEGTGLEGHPHQVLLLLTDGLAGDQQEILRGAYATLGAGVPLVGGCAGDDLRMTRTFQIYGDSVHTDAVVAAAVRSDAPLGIGVRHGWVPVGEPMVVTASGGNRIFTLDGRPALALYLERLGRDVADCGSTEELAQIALTHPLGLGSRGEEARVRFIGGADFADQSLISLAEIPTDSLVWIMAGDRESVLEATDAACQESLVGFDRPPLGMLAFDCIARRRVLGEDGIKGEIDRIAAMAGGAPIAGFYTYGEIARKKGVHGFHNQTLVVLSVG